MLTRKEKALLIAIEGIHKYRFKIEPYGACYAIWHEDSNLGEKEVAEIINDKDYSNPNIAIMTEKQFINVFRINDFVRRKKPRKKSELQTYREYKRAKKAGLLDNLDQIEISRE